MVLLAGMIEPDGGMPGKTEEIRITNSLATLLFFVQQGNNQSAGAFRAHVEKLMRFLAPRRLGSLPKATAELASHAVELMRKGHVVSGNWMFYANAVVTDRKVPEALFWKEVSSVALRTKPDQTGTR